MKEKTIKAGGFKRLFYVISVLVMMLVLINMNGVTVNSVFALYGIFFRKRNKRKVLGTVLITRTCVLWLIRERPRGLTKLRSL